MKIIKPVFKSVFIFIGIFLLYVIISITHGTITDFQPESKIKLHADAKASQKVITDSILRIFSWNIGYGGLGKDSDFFYDNGGFLLSGGKMVRAHRSSVDANIAGISKVLEAQDADFILLQEVDFSSKRSYYINQYEKYQQIFSNKEATFAVNYKNARVPLPVLQPWKVMGKMNSGLASFSTFQSKNAFRYQFPGDYAWPTRIFQLDRCFALHRYTHQNGKEVIIINTHNSAYDKGGKLKKLQMEYLKGFISKEYEDGNYVIVGGDWNQDPPNFRKEILKLNPHGPVRENMQIDANYLPDWTWAWDPTKATNRSLKNKYEAGKTNCALIDFYLVSPNIRVDEIKTLEKGFEHSDHEPVLLKVSLL